MQKWNSIATRVHMRAKDGASHHESQQGRSEAIAGERVGREAADEGGKGVARQQDREQHHVPARANKKKGKMRVV
jgi:hypothetical protein